MTAYATGAIPHTAKAGEPARVRRGPLLMTALSAAVGGTAICLIALPALARASVWTALLFGALASAQLGTVAITLIRPTRRRILLAAVPSATLAALWLLARQLDVLPGPDPWASMSTTLGITGHICAALHAVAASGLGLVAALGRRRRLSLSKRLAAAVLVAPSAFVLTVAVVVGVGGASGGLTGGGTVAPRGLPAGRVSTVEYCRPGGVPLAMDLHTPPASARTNQPAPVAVYIHGGGLVLGNRKLTGFGATLANHGAALFSPLRQQLNSRGFVVASIDYRLTPAAPWPAPIEDVKCAVRFLRAHAAGLTIDPDRIGVWGPSGGGHLAAMLGLAGPAAGFDGGQYSEQSSAVQAVVDMFGPTDFTDFADASGFSRFIIQVGLGGSPAVRRSASPINLVTSQTPPFLILHGTEDSDVPPRHSANLARKLHAAGVPVTLIEVHGAGHTLATPGQQPSPGQLTQTVTDFLTTTLQTTPPQRTVR